MWLLRNDEKGLIYRITPGKQHIVSRKDGDLLLLGDQSISRKHAKLTVQNENGDEGIVLKDLGSKYGSFAVIGDSELTKLQQDQQVTLRDGDYVRFGSQWNSWRAEFVPLVVATSTLTQPEKASVKAMVEALGGQTVSEWTEQCSHITMNKLTVTVKVVCALAAGQRIVTPAYWKSMSEALSRMQSTLPNVDEFLPPLAEAILNPSEVSFAPNPARSKLFKGRTFVTATAKQMARIKPMITAAGGNVVDFSSESWSESQLTQENVVLMQQSPGDRQGSQQSQVPEGYNPIARKLRAAGVRCVPESEIGLSIIYCSASKFCNPRHSLILLKPSQASSRQATQRMTEICPSSESSVSFNNDNDCSERPTSNKRPCISNEEEGPQKKAKNSDDSEDMFESQCSNKSHKSGFAKTHRQTSLNFPRSSTSNDSSSASKPKTSNNPAPSLDMFALSGGKSGRPVTVNVEESGLNPVRPSCQDIFASNKGLQEKTSNDKDELSLKTINPLRNVTNEDDEFSFVSSKKPKRPRDMSADENDEFSFVQTKRPNNKIIEKTEVDEFSFTSTRKRNRQRDPDMFASSTENPGTDSVSSLSKIKKTDIISNNPSSSKFEIKNSNRNDDNLFAFSNDRKFKKKSSNSDDVLESGEEVKLAILSKNKESASELNESKTNNEAQIYIQPDRKDLITYGKTIPVPDNLKKEVKEEEVDALAQEFQNTTIVIVTSLLANREKPAATQTNATVKNFKKFQKVVGVKKRLIPKIIGGSDLVPFCKSDRKSPSPQPQPLPQQKTPNDIWSFGNLRKRR